MKVLKALLITAAVIVVAFVGLIFIGIVGAVFMPIDEVTTEAEMISSEIDSASVCVTEEDTGENITEAYEEATDNLTQEVSTKTELTTKTEYTTKTDATTKPEVTTKAEVTTKPEITTKPEVTTQHAHSFSNATCTEPAKCSCGAINGSAKGHNWKSATCTEKKTCTVCGTKEGTTTAHNYSGGRCTVCYAQDPNYVSDVLVWIPTNGGTKYHSHSGCSKMKNPIQVPKSSAVSQGFGPCARCY